MRGLSIALLQCICSWLALMARACHILPLTEEGFGGNMLHLLHAIAIYENKGGGPFFVDHTRFPYRCDDSNSGGFSDFWNYTGVLAWSKEDQAKLEKSTRTTCKRLDYLAVDHQVSLMGATWDELDAVALRRVGKQYALFAQSLHGPEIACSRYVGIRMNPLGPDVVSRSTP